MEDQNTEPAQKRAFASTEIHASNKLGIQIILQIVLVLAAIIAVYGIYYQQHQKIDKLSTDISQKQQALKIASAQLTQLTNTNSGIIESLPRTASSNTVSLYNGQVTFAMPSGWVTATASHYNEPCYIGGLAEQFCLATSIIVPKASNNNKTLSTSSSILITVFKHSDSTTAAEWFTNDFDNVGYDVTAAQLPSTIINGYNASVINPSDATAAYYNTSSYTEYYVFTNKSYVAMLTFSSNVANSTIKTFAGSIKLQEN